MLTQFFTIGTLMLFAVMLPGPDFALIAKNSILYDRRAGLFTALGISIANLIHISYCLLGLAIIISQSLFFFSAVKFLGAIYLIYLGVLSFRSKKTNSFSFGNHYREKKIISNSTAFKQGFLCNIFNPKATLFFLSLFTMVIKADTPLLIRLIYAIEMFSIIIIWFSSLTLLISHHKIISLLKKMEVYIEKLLGFLFIGFGIALAFH